MTVGIPSCSTASQHFSIELCSSDFGGSLKLWTCACVPIQKVCNMVLSCWKQLLDDGNLWSLAEILPLNSSNMTAFLRCQDKGCKKIYLQKKIHDKEPRTTEQQIAHLLCHLRSSSSSTSQSFVPATTQSFTSTPASRRCKSQWVTFSIVHLFLL